MHILSIIKAVTVGLLASVPLAAAFGVSDIVDFEKRHVGSLAAYASKVVRAAVPEVIVEKRQAADEFGPWDSEEDEFGSWVDKREPHHTEGQIAAKNAAAAASSNANSASASTKSCNRNKKRHHTEAQVAAKQAKAAAASSMDSADSATDDCDD